MLESEIKKLTVAVEANTAAILATQGGANVVPATQTPVQAPVPQTPAIPAVAPAIPAPVAAQPVQPPVAQPGIPAVAQPAASVMDHKQAQAELAQIVQQLGDAAPVQATMLQYGSAQLGEIPAENLFSLVAACRLLRTA